MFGLHNYTGFVAASLISLVDQAGLMLVGDSIAGRLARFPRANVLGRPLVGLGLIGFGGKLAENQR
jgi:threonine/homoserine/homoserine lactone efflux protein